MNGEKSSIKPSTSEKISLIAAIITLVVSIASSCYHQLITVSFVLFLSGAVAWIFRQIISKKKIKYNKAVFILNSFAFVCILWASLVYDGKMKMKRHLNIRCRNNLKQIGICLFLYADDFQGFLPLQDGVNGLSLVQPYAPENARYFCKSKKLPCKGKLNNENTSYAYIGGYNLKEPITPPPITTPVAFDLPGNHQDCTNVLFLDAHVETYKINPKSCKEIIEYLHEKYKYPPELLRKLQRKAIEADLEYGFPKVNR